MSIIDIHELDKRFGAVTALDKLTLTVEPGEVRGFLGPNGAGKTTAIRVLLGLLRADAGRVRLFGGDPWADAVSLHRRLAYVPGDMTLWPNLTGGEAVDYLLRLHGAAEPTRKAELFERFDLDPTKKARTYSKGNRQKVALVAALARDAELYILDEPTSGLDPLMESVFIDTVLELKRQGRAVLLSSHILSEVEKVCDTVTIIRAGPAVESGTLADLRHLTRSRVDAVIRTDDSTSIAALPGVHGLAAERADSGTRVTFDLDDTSLDAVLGPMAAHGIESLSLAPPSLEDLFLRHYGDAQPARAGEGAR